MAGKIGRPRGSLNKPKVAKQEACVFEKKKRSRLTTAQKEVILQIYFTTGTIAGTARKCGCASQTIKNVIQTALQDPALVAGRARALDSLAGKVHEVAERVIDSISPGELDTSYDPKCGPTGNFTGWALKGPSLRDKALAISAMADKLRILQAARSDLLNPQAGVIGEADRIMMFPQSVAEARNLIAQKVKRLRILDMEFHAIPNDRIDQLAHNAKVSEADILQATVVDIDPVSVFDG